MCDAGDLSATGATGAMTAKYFVYGSGRWRAVDLESGRVAGWRRRTRFVYLQRGRLQLARRGAVLRALRALAAGAPSAAADGPRLPTRRYWALGLYTTTYIKLFDVCPTLNSIQ